MWHRIRVDSPPKIVDFQSLTRLTGRIMYEQGRWDQYISSRTGIPMDTVKLMRDSSRHIGVDELSSYGMNIDIRSDGLFLSGSHR